MGLEIDQRQVALQRLYKARTEAYRAVCGRSEHPYWELINDLYDESLLLGEAIEQCTTYTEAHPLLCKMNRKIERLRGLTWSL